MPGAQQNTYIAGATVNPFVFLQSFVGTRPAGILDVELLCLQCSGPGVEIIGIGSEWTNSPYGLINQPTPVPAATVGQQVRVYGDGDETIISVGSGYNVVPGNLLVSDASGNAIPVNMAAAGLTWIGARALETGNAGDPIRVTVVLRPLTVP